MSNTNLRAILATTMSLMTGCISADIENEAQYEDIAQVSDTRPERHCFVRMTPGDVSGAPAKLGAMACYDTISEVVSAATNGQVVLPTTTRASDVNEAMLVAAGYRPTGPSNAVGDTLIGYDYTEPNYGGNSLTWWSSVPCYDRFTGGSYNLSTSGMPAGWDDMISSSKVAVGSGCRTTTYYDYVNNGGLSMSASNCYVPSLSFMDNRTSSRAWLRSGPVCF